MPSMDGVDLCAQLHELAGDLPVIVMSGRSDMPSVLASLRAGAEDYLLKPLDVDAVLWCLKRALARRAANVEREGLSRLLNERLVLTSLREQEHAESEALQRAQLSTLLENLNEGAVIADESGSVVMINDAARAILGLGPADARTAHALYSLDLRDLKGRTLDPEERPLARALRGERFTDYEVVHSRPNEEQRHLLSTGSCVRGEKCNVALAIVVFRDVTELKRLEQQREEFLGLITHDLRSPLNSLSMCVSLLKDSFELNPGAQQDVAIADRATRNVKRMVSMLNELTEATSLEAKAVLVHREPCDLRGVLASAIDSLHDVGARRIRVEADPASSYVVLGDVLSLERVVVNLLTNALKYSADDALVTARLVRVGKEIELHVTDRGIGISPETVTMLFQRYYRTKPGTARASGLGLGLYIARLVTEAHGGRIRVSSEVGAGSTFTLSLPSVAERHA
jgi:PAS domain S-box-containing protein